MFLYQLSFSESSDEGSSLSIYARACQHAKEVSFQVESFLGFVSSFQVSAAESRGGVPLYFCFSLPVRRSQVVWAGSVMEYFVFSNPSTLIFW